jgi:hypothetical protein
VAVVIVLYCFLHVFLNTADIDITTLYSAADMDVLVWIVIHEVYTPIDADALTSV